MPLGASCTQSGHKPPVCLRSRVAQSRAAAMERRGDNNNCLLWSLKRTNCRAPFFLGWPASICAAASSHSLSLACLLLLRLRPHNENIDGAKTLFARPASAAATLACAIGPTSGRHVLAKWPPSGRDEQSSRSTARAMNFKRLH